MKIELASEEFASVERRLARLERVANATALGVRATLEGAIRPGMPGSSLMTILVRIAGITAAIAGRATATTSLVHLLEQLVGEGPARGVASTILDMLPDEEITPDREAEALGRKHEARGEKVTS